jgi:hypothetical protein
MTPEEIKKLIETTLNGSIKNYWVYLVISFFVGIIITVGIEFFKAKGQNIATKQDIEEITKKVEQVKAEIQKGEEIGKQKRELKYKALLTSLNLIDAHLSFNLIPGPGQQISKQYATTEEARTCHNNLILTCEDTKVLDLFALIMFGPKDKNKPQIPSTDLLNQYRNLVRKELGFGNNLELDRDRAWFGKVIFEK